MAKRSSGAKLRREISQKFKGWSVVSEGGLDKMGDFFESDLSGHDPYMMFLEANDKPAAIVRPPGNLAEHFRDVGEAERKQLTVEAGMAKIRYRESLVEEYNGVLYSEDLPFKFQLSGKAAKDLRDDFLRHAASGRQVSLEDNKRMWNTLSPQELEAARKLKAVLNELVEVVCCGPDLARAYDDRDFKVSYTCQHAARVLTPYLPLCSDEQLGRLAALLGSSDEDDYVRYYTQEMFAAWDYSFECSWVWDVLLETVANCTRGDNRDITEYIVPILDQCEPWGGPMHEEQVLACAAALAFDNYGLARVHIESMRDDDSLGRAWNNGALFCELMRLQAADADNVVMKACQLDVIDLFVAGGYLEWLAALKLPASNRQRINTAKTCAEMTIDQEYAHTIIPKQREKVDTWLKETECLQQPEAVAKEVLAGRRRAAFDEAVKSLVGMRRVTAAAIRKHLAKYQEACKALEGAGQSGSARTSRKESTEASTSGSPTLQTDEAKAQDTGGKSDKVCGHCKAPAKDGAKLKKCSKCRKARYCGSECQRLAWKAGHKEMCCKSMPPSI